MDGSERLGVRFAFEPFRLDVERRRLTRVTEQGEKSVQLGSRALEILLLLVRRRGTLVGKADLIDAVWPGIAVEDNNLTVQMSALRRTLGDEPGGSRWIETVPGRGYRFVAPVTEIVEPLLEVPPDLGVPVVAPSHTPVRRFAIKSWPPLAVFAALFAALLGAIAVVRFSAAPPPDSPPALSIAVLPFSTNGPDPAYDYMAEAITDDLTMMTAGIESAFVIARETARSFKGQTDSRRTAAQLGVRYLLSGSVRPIGPLTRVSAQLVEADTGATIWAEQFDRGIVGLPAAQDEAVNRIAATLGSRLVDAEAKRVAYQRPANADAMDLVLRARSILNLPQNLERNEQATILLRQAFERDPLFLPAITYLGNALVFRGASLGDNAGQEARIMEARGLLAKAAALNPRDFGVLSLKANLLQVDGAWDDAAVAYREAVAAQPNWSVGYDQLALCAMMLGHPEEALALLEKSLRLNPRSAEIHDRYALMGRALLSLNRNEEAVEWLRRAIQASPPPQSAYREFLAAALARAGHLAPAATELLRYLDRHPCATASQIRHVFEPPSARVHWHALADGLALAGLRDTAGSESHVGRLPAECDTSTVMPLKIMRLTTAELQKLVAKRTAPLLVQPFQTDVTIPGTVIVNSVTTADAASAAVEALRLRLDQLTGGDLNRPIVAVSWNVATAGGQHFAASLVSMGYHQVYTYPDGLEAWIAHDLPVEVRDNL